MSRRLAVVALALAVGATPLACDGDDDADDAGPAPSTSSSSSSTSTTIDYTSVSLSPIASPGASTTTRPAQGLAVILGKVLDGNGAPVPAAIVRATYYGDPEAPEIIEAATGEDGGFRFEKLLGGRWRIRAWQAPFLASLEVAPFFLGATEERTVDVNVKVVPDVDVTASMAPDPPLVGDPAELAVLVVTQTVDVDGTVIRDQAPATEVGLITSGGWTYTAGSAPLNTTDDDGTARWTLICGAEGTLPISAVVLGREFRLKVPSCLSPASTTTTVSPDASSTTSTTTKKKTTTTTRPKPTASTRPPIRPT